MAVLVAVASLAVAAVTVAPWVARWEVAPMAGRSSLDLCTRHSSLFPARRLLPARLH